MKFYKTICQDKRLKCFAIDEEFVNSSKEIDLLQKINSETSFYWNKKVNAIVDNSIDLRDVFNFYRVNESISNLASVFSSKNISKYKDLEQKITSIYHSYDSLRLSKYNIYDLVPLRILKDFMLSEILVLKDSYDFLKEKSWCDKVIQFFQQKAKTNILTSLNFPIHTKDGETKVDLLWQANFRFKSAPGSLNLFNMQKQDRYKVIPQDEDSIIYCADFRQFEIRTFCMIHPELEVDFSNREIYKDFAERLSLDPNEAKDQIIAYGYGQKNDKLDNVLNRNAILENVNDDFYSWRGYPVILRSTDEDKIKIHTIVQTISQYIYLEKLEKILKLLNGTKSKFMYPLHDSIIVSLHKDEMDLIPKFVDALEDEVYKVSHESGPNFAELKKLPI